MSDKDKEKEKEKEKTESKPGDLGLLEEDDEFEEFPAEGENLLVNSMFNRPLVKNKMPAPTFSTCQSLEGLLHK